MPAHYIGANGGKIGYPAVSEFSCLHRSPDVRLRAPHFGQACAGPPWPACVLQIKFGVGRTQGPALALMHKIFKEFHSLANAVKTA